MNVRRHRERRRGLAIAPAMICVVLVFLICAGLVRQVHTLREETRGKGSRLQAAWLAESGLARAAARLAADRKYSGETWEVAAAELGSAHPGIVRITVKPEEGKPDRRQVRVEADYPKSDRVQPHRKSEVISIDLGPENSGGSS